MAEYGSTSPQDGDSAQGIGDEKPRLTEEEKKQNHIASEQKRREAIRAGFDRLCELVPGLEGQGRSEGLVLKRTVDYMRLQLIRRRELVIAAEARGEIVSDEMRAPLAILQKLEERDKKTDRVQETNGDDD
ncbi:putative helix-loop-helix DNA-binding domain-containing protein [Rosellinia necatrix]|uniref:Putative helix-loop-helix DNA-binding domain-containing protein n=1 Tax=Rosellinia necatrix TaxID=77044 RepID=A0A1W2TIW2_ROSNE|nr:putative helix-loop-helix DNA-binding domain-containing protein [Rosellinia necatrix]